jgi:NDP-sugar pyrophosphorylase family protein
VTPSGSSAAAARARTLGDLPVALLAGGRALRLGALAATTPKCLLEVAGRPFLDLQLERLARQGARRVVLCLGHLAEAVERHVARMPRFGLELVCRRDGPRPLGTAGALRQALPDLGELFFVLYGDAYLDVDHAALLRDFESRARDALGLLTVFRNRNRWGRSNARFSGDRLIRYDKRAPTPDMEHIDYGLALLRREALTRLAPDEPADLADVYRDLVAEGLLLGHEVDRRFYEIGTPDGLAETRALVAGPGTAGA